MSAVKQEMSGMIEIKAVFLFMQGLISWALVWAGVSSETFFILAVLLLFDFITGVWKAHTLGDNLASNKMKYGVISKLSLLIIPISIGLGIRAMGQESDDLLFIAMNILILSEVYSIIGNIYSVRTGERIPEYDALSAIAKSIRKRFSDE